LRPGEGRGAPWPYAGAIAVEERDAESARRVWHVIDNWQYLGSADSLAHADALRASVSAPAFELTTYRVLSERLARGLAVTPLGAGTLTLAV
jgi:DNA polymerase-3 subunit epsilon